MFGSIVEDMIKGHELRLRLSATCAEIPTISHDRVMSHLPPIIAPSFIIRGNPLRIFAENVDVFFMPLRRHLLLIGSLPICKIGFVAWTADVARLRGLFSPLIAFPTCYEHGNSLLRKRQLV